MLGGQEINVILNDKLLKAMVVIVILGILVYMAVTQQDPGASWQSIIVLVLGGVFFKGKPPERRKPSDRQRQHGDPPTTRKDQDRDKRIPYQDDDYWSESTTLHFNCCAFPYPTWYGIC